MRSRHERHTAGELHGNLSTLGSAEHQTRAEPVIAREPVVDVVRGVDDRLTAYLAGRPVAVR